MRLKSRVKLEGPGPGTSNVEMMVSRFDNEPNPTVSSRYPKSQGRFMPVLLWLSLRNDERGEKRVKKPPWKKKMFLCIK